MPAKRKTRTTTSGWGIFGGLVKQNKSYARGSSRTAAQKRAAAKRKRSHKQASLAFRITHALAASKNS